MLRAAELDEAGVKTVRVLYSDLHGIARGTEVPAGEFARVADEGLTFCAAIMGTDLRHTPVVGAEAGYPDLIARPDLSTLAPVPWEPGVAWCIADLEPASSDHVPADPRGAVRRAVAAFEELGYVPVVGPELEFYLCAPDEAAAHGIRRYVDAFSMVYRVGPQADPDGVVREIADALSGLGVRAYAANHEFGNAQYEINLRHAPALEACDRAFQLKTAVKDVAAARGLIATFMGKPFNDQNGSGAHLHVSLSRRGGANAFAAGDGVSDVLRHFAAGVLAHAAGLTAILNPTVNAYRRLVRDSLAPTHVNWGWDNRTAFIRIPPERGPGARVEVRAGDASANPYLAVAAVLFAGLRGVRERLALGAPVTGDAYALADPGAPLPATLDAALDALAGDAVLCEALGAPIAETFLALKRSEADRHRRWVSDWEIAEYLHHL